MKVLKLLVLAMCFPIYLFAQTADNDNDDNNNNINNYDRSLLHGYGYLMLHDGHFGGGVTGNYFLFKYLGLGPGVEITSFNHRTLVPAFLDLKLRYPLPRITPYIEGQFGYNAYSSHKILNAGGQQIEYNEKGKQFYGVGGGITYQINKYIGVFAAYTYRGYTYKNPKDIVVNEELIPIPDEHVSTNVFTLGVVF
ncbi:hypothetical protein ACDQ55_09515 [Chitinophaga sp. 30R24]|uniref:hypothetical protein n=1 Tax=Chitinophaga sp. 30R24 TaxID=3248838 RepID=UPI003B91A9B1